MEYWVDILILLSIKVSKETRLMYIIQQSCKGFWAQMVSHRREQETGAQMKTRVALGDTWTFIALIYYLQFWILKVPDFSPGDHILSIAYFHADS